jgi:uncharacterized membrane protein
MDGIPASGEGRLFFEAVLCPQRSLSRNAMFSVIGIMAGASMFMTVTMYVLGAWPVIGFNGADLALVIILFWLNTRAARAREIVRLGRQDLEITRITPGGQMRVTVLSPAWARAELEEKPGTVPHLLLATRSNREEIGRQLGEAQKRDLAAAINCALAHWRSAGFQD